MIEVIIVIIRDVLGMFYLIYIYSCLATRRSVIFYGGYFLKAMS